MPYLRVFSVFASWPKNYKPCNFKPCPVIYFVDIRYCYLKGFMCFIEKETPNFKLKFKDIFPLRETVLRAHGMKSDEKPFFFQIYAIFWSKNGTCCHWQVFSRTSEEFWRFFLNPMLSLKVPLRLCNILD